MIIVVLFYGCSEKPDNTFRVIDTIYSSEILGKDMQLKVYTPPAYTEDNSYPVLYFFHDWGGSVYTVMDQYGIAEKAETLIINKQIYPLIIVAVDIDRSFGLNSSETVKTIETSSGKIFETGRYTDYFLEEIIPFIDSEYSTISAKNGRYIGGYSMGGFAALHIALSNPEMFSKVGGHSPSIFINEFPDVSVSDFLYPTIDLRRERDPIYIVQDNEILGLEMFLDVEAGGSQGVEYLYKAAIENGISAEFQVLSFSHSRTSCYENMEQYLLFYAGYD